MWLSDGNRIQKLTTRGEFIGTFGEKGSFLGQFDYPYDVKISPDGKIYVADTRNNRILVFYSDLMDISHVIDGRVSGDGSFTHPKRIAFDLLGNLHVIGYSSTSSVTVFTPSGKFVRQYGCAFSGTPTGIAIDPSGYSLITSYGKIDKLGSALLVFSPNANVVVCLVEGLFVPAGVFISPIDQSVWVCDGSRLVKY